MSSDENQFEELYQSLPSGLIVAACTSMDQDVLTSFCRSLKGAAIRLGSNAMHFWSEYSRSNWKTKGIEHFKVFVEKHKINGVRLFLINRSLDSSIDPDIARQIEEAALAKCVTAIVTTAAENVLRGQLISEETLAVRDGKNVRFRNGGSGVILLERHRAKGFSYSATVVKDSKARHYGPLYFLSESP